MIYSCVIFTLLHSFIAFSLIRHLQSTESLIYSGFHKSLLGKIVVTLDHVLQMLMNSVGPLLVLINRKRFYHFFQHFKEFEQMYQDSNPKIYIAAQNKRIKSLLLVCLTVYTFGLVLTFVINGRVSYSLMFSVFIMVSHFIFTQLYEFSIFQKLTLHFVSLKKDFRHLTRKKWIGLQMELWELSTEGSKLFTFIRIVLLICANALISLMWFYNLFGHVIGFLNSFIWQLIIMTILVMCNTWHRLGREVGTKLD